MVKLYVDKRKSEVKLVPCRPRGGNPCMRTRQRIAAITVVVGSLLLSFFSSLPAGQIDPGCRMSLLSKRERPVSAILTLSDRLDIEAIKDSLTAEGAGRREAHRA